VGGAQRAGQRAGQQREQQQQEEAGGRRLQLDHKQPPHPVLTLHSPDALPLPFASEWLLPELTKAGYLGIYKKKTTEVRAAHQ
jgi:hypothetical protein